MQLILSTILAALLNLGSVFAVCTTCGCATTCTTCVALNATEDGACWWAQNALASESGCYPFNNLPQNWIGVPTCCKYETNCDDCIGQAAECYWWNRTQCLHEQDVPQGGLQSRDCSASISPTPSNTPSISPSPSSSVSFSPSPSPITCETAGVTTCDNCITVKQECYWWTNAAGNASECVFEGNLGNMPSGGTQRRDCTPSTSPTPSSSVSISSASPVASSTPSTSPTSSISLSATTSPSTLPTSSISLSATTSPSTLPTSSISLSATTSPSTLPTSSISLSATTSPSISLTSSISLSATTSPCISLTSSISLSATTSPSIAQATSPSQSPASPSTTRSPSSLSTSSKSPHSHHDTCHEATSCNQCAQKSNSAYDAATCTVTVAQLQCVWCGATDKCINVSGSKAYAGADPVMLSNTSAIRDVKSAYAAVCSANGIGQAVVACELQGNDNGVVCFPSGSFRAAAFDAPTAYLLACLIVFISLSA